MKSKGFNMLSWLKSLIIKMMPDTLAETYSSDMDSAIAQWLEIYNDNPSWSKKCHDKTSNFGTTIASEFARLIMIEFQSEITGSKRADYLNEQYKQLTDTVLRVKLEKACAVGGMILKPYVQNGKILPDCITQDNFIPIEYSDREITGAVFFAREVRGKAYYTRIEKQIYDYKERTHKIANRFFVSNSYDKLGKETDNSICFSDMEPFCEISDVDRPLFAFWRVPFANQIEPESPLGVSIYSRAIKQLKEADLQWDRYLWEFQGGALAVHAGESLLRKRNVGSNNANQIRYELPESSSRLFRTFTGDVNNPMYEVFSPAIRDENYARGLDKILRKIEFNCSLAYGTISDPQNVDKTAEEIRSSKQRSYATVSDMQQSLQSALENYIYALNEITSACNLAPKGNYEVQFNWGDGVLEDSDKEQAIRLQEVNSNITDKKYYLKWRYGVTDEQAEQMIPKSGVTDFFGGS